MAEKNFILASGSQQRKSLLDKIGYSPKKVCPADIDESIKKGEKPTDYVKRMALEKAKFSALQNPSEVILTADTVVIVGRRIILKAKNAEEQTQIMKLLSGKAHKVLTAVCVVNKQGKISQRLTSTRLIAKKFSDEEIESYVKSNNWIGSSGYKIEVFESYIKKIIGSYSGVIGLPLYETKNLLNGAGIK